MKVRHCGHWGVDQIPNWSLYRRYNDFYRLHQNLITDFPEAILKFPPKRWIGDNYDSIFIGQRSINFFQWFQLMSFPHNIFIKIPFRISNLNKYLDSVLKNKDLDVRDSHYVNDFLCLGSPPSRSTSISSCRVTDINCYNFLFSNFANFLCRCYFRLCMTALKKQSGNFDIRKKSYFLNIL